MACLYRAASKVRFAMAAAWLTAVIGLSGVTLALLAATVGVLIAVSRGSL